MRLLATVLALSVIGWSAEKKIISPPGIGADAPYSPGVLVNDFLYVSGQGGLAPDGKLPGTFEAQARQALSRIKDVVVAAGLSMEHVVYAHVYLKDVANYDAFNTVWHDFFPKAPPAQGILGVYAMPGGSAVLINAVAFRDLPRKRIIAPRGYPSNIVSPAVMAGERIFVSACLGRNLDGSIPADPAAQVKTALDHMKNILSEAKLDFRHMVFINPYQTDQVQSVMNKVYAEHFEFGNTPARATIRATSLPYRANIAFTGVGISNLSKRRAIKPKNMAPSPTASPCVFADDTFYCSAKSAFIPPNEGIYIPTVEGQAVMSMRSQLDSLDEADLKPSDIVSMTVYLDDLNDLPKTTNVLGRYFPSRSVTGSTVAQIAPHEPGGQAQPDARARFPSLEQFSLIAVK
jgi:2-iminobutanoate/2-iminopropanoate deaminase